MAIAATEERWQKGASAASMQQNIFLSQQCVAQLRVPHWKLLALLWSEIKPITLHKQCRIIIYYLLCFCWRQHLSQLSKLNKIFMFVSNYCKHLLIMNYLLLAWLLSDEALVLLKDKMCSVSFYFLHPKHSVIQAKINMNHRSCITLLPKWEKTKECLWHNSRFVLEKDPLKWHCLHQGFHAQELTETRL